MPNSHVVGIVKGLENSVIYGFQKWPTAAQDLCRAAAGDELPAGPVPFIAVGTSAKETISFRSRTNCHVGRRASIARASFNCLR